MYAMKYIFINYNDEQYWIEIGNDGYALRQIIIEPNSEIHVSCSEDCLAEGIINAGELDGKIQLVEQDAFESRWNNATAGKRKNWEDIKMMYPIGKEVECRVKYSYPQGWILELGQWLGVCKGSLTFQPEQMIFGHINGYDDVNMWLCVEVK
jgi:hypothetical protein